MTTRRLVRAPRKDINPLSARSRRITGEPMRIKWGPNWEDDLAGVCETGAR